MENEPQAYEPRCYCMQLRNAANALTGFYDKLLAPHGLTIRQYSLLSNLDRIGACTRKELARGTSLEPSSLTRILKPLIERGLVADTSAAGTRASRIELTEAGTHLLAEATRDWERAQRRVEELAGKESLEQMKRTLGVLRSIQQA